MKSPLPDADQHLVAHDGRRAERGVGTGAFQITAPVSAFTQLTRWPADAGAEQQALLLVLERDRDRRRLRVGLENGDLELRPPSRTCRRPCGRACRPDSMSGTGGAAASRNSFTSIVMVPGSSLSFAPWPTRRTAPLTATGLSLKRRERGGPWAR
jgi:hypothetical protein